MTDVFSDRCFKAHDKMPYRWEVREDDKWTALPDNETIEKDYCDPKNTYRYSLLTFNRIVVLGRCYSPSTNFFSFVCQSANFEGGNAFETLFTHQ